METITQRANEGVIHINGMTGKVVPDPTTSGLSPIDAWLNCPVDPRRIIDQQALATRLVTLRNQTAAAPMEALEGALQRRKIDAHNAEIDKAKAQKRQLRDIAKQTGMPLEQIKRMVKNVRRA